MATTQVRGVQIKDNDLTFDDIADGAVRGATGNGGSQRELATGTVSDVDIRNSAITALKIDSTQNFSMNKLTLGATTSQITFGTTNTTTLSFSAPAANRTYSIPDSGTNSSILLSDGNQTINNNQTFTGVVFVANGTAGAPSLAFTNSTTTGLFRGGSSILSVTTGGTEALRVNASQNTDFLQHQVLQLVVEVRASDPSTPVEGQIWYRSDTHQWSGYNGTTNVVLG